MDAEHELIAAAGFAGTRPSVEPLLDQARAVAYTRSEVTLNTNGPNQVDTVFSEKNHVKQAPITVEFGKASYSFPMSIKVSAAVDLPNGQREISNLRLGRSFLPTRDHFTIATEGLNANTLKGICATSNDVTTCHQSITDGSGKPILLGVSISNYESNHNNFSSTTDFYDPVSKAFKAELTQQMITSDIAGGPGGENKSMRIESVLDPHAIPKVPLDK